jgi:chromosomal replication initiation ATPase DnaA
MADGSLGLGRTDSALPSPAPGSLRAIAEEVACLYGLTLSELKSRTRKRSIATPRQHAMAEMREQRRPDGARRYSCGQIANFFGMSDHTTVVYGIKAHRARAGSKGRTLGH